jgi:hypothetical protein
MYKKVLALSLIATISSVAMYGAESSQPTEGGKPGDNDKILRTTIRQDYINPASVIVFDQGKGYQPFTLDKWYPQVSSHVHELKKRMEKYENALSTRQK